MKKILFAIVFCLLFQTCSYARDYAKLHVKEIKHAQKYGVSAKYNKSYAPDVNIATKKYKRP